MTSSDKLTHILSSLNIDSIRTYVYILGQKGLTSSEIQSKLDSTQKFLEWAYYSDKISFSKYQQIKDEIANFAGPVVKKAITEASNEQLSVPLHNSDPMTPKKAGFLSKIPFFGTSSQDILTPSLSNRPVVFISVALLLLGTAIVGRGIYDRFFSNTDTTLAYAPTPVVASRILSFQGRLTDSLGNPITASTNMRFRLYTASSGGTTLYDSGTCSIAPDQDGVHNVLIGSDCGAEVSSSVFTENGEVYLGVTVGADSEMTPRQRMANVPYAQNSETLQGLPLGKDVSSVPYINNAGDLLISAASPQIGSTYASQTFVVSSANAVTLQSAGTGDVTLTATGSGELKFLVGGATAGVVNNSGNWGIKSSNPSTFELQVNGDVGPETDSAFDLGSNSVRWANVYADNIVGTITPGFTAGSVAFADGSGNLAQDNAQFFFDDANNRLGIGTAVPLGKFHLTGASTGKALAILNETGDQNILTASASGTTVANLDRSGNLSVEGTLSDLSGATLDVNDNLDISGTLTSGTANAFGVDATGNISTSGTTGLSFTSTGGIVLAGGTITDGTDGVDINDDLEIAGGTTLGDASGDTVTANAASWTFANDTNYILSGGINGLSFDSTTLSVDATNDRIGIGTAAPDAAWVDIAAATTGKSQLNLTTSAGTNVSTPNSGDLWWNGTNLYFYNGSTNNDLLASGGSVAGSDTQVQYNNGGSFGGASALIYDDVNNRVGIGSATSPTSLFHVAGAVTGKALSIFNETGDQALLTASASGTTRYTLANNGNITYSPSAFGTPITLYDVDTTLPNANIGIVDAINDAYTAAIGGGGGLWTDSGTTTYLTTTTDDIVLGGSSPLSSGKLSIDGDADQIQLIVQGNGTQTSSLAVFEQSDGTDVLTISNAGNLAFAGGTLSDTSDGVDIADDLEISGGTTLGDASGDTVTANAAAWTFANDTTVALSGGVNGLNFDSNTLSIDAAGDKIGIGTAAPDAKFQVTGAVTGKALAIFDETGDQDIISASASGSTRFRVSNDGTIYGGYLLDISNTAYGIDPAGTTNFGGYSMKITGGALLAADSGNVGIGDQTPDAKLNVLSTTEQLRLDYDDSNYTSFTVGSGGDLTIAPTGSDTNVTGNLAISGGTTLGDASGDTVTANAAAWTFANDTTVALTGGVDGLNFDSNTLSIDATNNRVGIGTAAPTSPLTITAGTGGTSIPILSVTQQDNSGQPPVAQFIGTGGGTITMTWAGNISLQDTKTVHNSSYTQSYLSFSAGSTIVQSQNSTILFKDYNSGAYSEWARFSSTGSFGVNTTGPDAKIDSLSTSGEQLRLTHTDGTAYTGFTVASSGDLTFDSSGGDFNLANADVLNIGGNADDVAFNAIGDDTANAANVNSDNDLYVEDDLEVDGTIFGSLEGTVDLNFTDGSVLFANSSGAIAQDNASFFFDDTTNKLGLGDTTPDAFIDSTGTTEQLRLSYETGDTNYTSFTTSSGGDLTIAPTGADIAFTGTGDFSAGLKAGTSDHFNIDSSGNIGIGTTAASGYGLRMSKSIDSSTMSTYYLDHKAVTYTGIPSGSYYQGDAVAVTNNTTSGGPYHTLRTANFANSASTWQGYSAAGYSAYLSNNVAANSAYFTGYGSTTVNASTATAQEYTNYLSGTTNQVGGTISIARGFRSTINNASTGTISTVYNFLADTPTNGSGTITTAYGAYIADQSVGTNTTAYGLYVANQSGSSGNAIGLYIADSDDYSIQLASTDGDAASGITFGTDTNLYRNGANSLHTDDALDIDGAFTTDGDVAVNGDDITSDSNLTINAAGYVRIGDTASPVSANGDDDLFVEGDLEIDGVMYLDGTLDTSFTAGSVVFAGTSGVLAQDNSSFFFDDSSNELGLGDTTPDAFIDITGTTEQLRLSYETGDTNYASFTLGSGGDLTIAPTGGDVAVTGNGDFSGGLNVAASDYFQVNSAGNIGIGTTATTNYGIRFSQTVDTSVASTSYADRRNVYFTGTTGGTYYYGNELSLNISSATTGNYYGTQSNFANNSASCAGCANTAYWTYSTNNVAANSVAMRGYRADLANASTGTSQDYRSFLSTISNGSTGSISTAVGYTGDITNSSSGTISTAYQHLVNSPTNASGTITNIYGMYIADQSVGTNTNAYGMYIASQAGASGNAIGLYIADSEDYSIQLASTDGDAASGITFGTDTNLYRSAADTLKTDDAFFAVGNITTSGDLAVNGDDITADGALTLNSASYIRVGDTASPASANGDDDLFVEGDLEVDGVMYLDGTLDTSFTSGSVVFAGTSGVLAQDNSSFFFDDTNNRLGIGDTTPDSFLDITGTTAQLRLSYETGDTNYSTFTTDSGGDLTLDPTGGDIVADANFNPNTDDTYDLGTDTKRWRDLYLGPDTLHVGTSTTDEGTLKYVTSTNVLTMTNNFGDTDFGSTSDGFNFTLGGGAGDDFIVDATTLVVESDNDRVGIGTAAPSAKTHIIATTEQLRLGYDVSNYGSFTTSSGGDLAIDMTGNDVATPDRVTIGSSTAGTAKLTVTGAETGKALAIFNETGDQAIIVASKSGSLYFSVNHTGDVTKGDSHGVIGLNDQASLAPNASFEINSDGTGLPDGWVDRVGTSTTTTTSNHGTTALLLDDQNDEVYSTCFPIAGGQSFDDFSSRTYKVSGWFRGIVGSLGTDFQAGLYSYTSKSNCESHTSATTHTPIGYASMGTTYAALAGNVTPALGQTWARGWAKNVDAQNDDFYVDGFLIWPTTTTHGLDLAETYPADPEENIHVAEIVSMGKEGKQDDADIHNIVKSSEAYDKNAFGVVATQPGLVLDDEHTYKKVKVALKGRVPVLVTTENGPIAIGDPITSSSIPGVGMKATRSGRIIGYAMSEYTNPNASEIDQVTVFVNPETYIDMSILTNLQDSIANINLQATAQTVVSSSVQTFNSLLITTEKLVAQTIEVTNATIDTLIVDRIIARDVETQNLAAVTATIQDLETDTISTTSLDAEKVTTDILLSDTLAANSASISGTLVADNVDARNITEMRERLERLAASQDDSTVTSEQLDADLEQVQQYIDELTQSQSPENITDVETYQVSPPDMTLDAGSTETSLGQNVSAVNLESLIVTGTTSMTSLTVADAFSAGNIFIKDNTVVSMVNELKLSALESVDIMNGGVIIAKDGTLTAKGEVIAQKGVRTNTIKSLDGTSDVSVDLGQVDNSGTHSSFKVQADGNDVALIDSQGSADFKNLSLSTYSEATSSAVVIAAGDNYRQTGIYAPAIKTNAAASGNGILPSGQNDIIIFNDSIKKDTIVNLTPTSSSQNRSVYVDKVEACLDSSNELCQPYFRVAIDDTISNDVTFNWLIVN